MNQRIEILQEQYREIENSLTNLKGQREVLLEGITQHEIAMAEIRGAIKEQNSIIIEGDTK